MSEISHDKKSESFGPLEPAAVPAAAHGCGLCQSLGLQSEGGQGRSPPGRAPAGVAAAAWARGPGVAGARPRAAEHMPI